MVFRGKTFALAPLLAATLWGGMYVISKWGFDAIPPVTLAFLRVVLGAAALLVVVRFVYPRRSFSRRDWRGFAVLGVWVTVTMVTQFVGTQLTTASQGALITVLTPVFTLLLGIALFDEPFTYRKTLGLALATVGTVVVLTGQYDLTDLAAASATGIGLLLLASIGWAVYTVQGKPLIRRYSALETATYSTALAVPMHALLVPVELLARDVTVTALPLTAPIAVAVGYLGLFSTAAAWYLWYKGLEYADAGTVSVFFFAQPIVGAALGYAALGEDLGALFGIGSAIMAAGVYIVSTAPTHRSAA